MEQMSSVGDTEASFRLIVPDASQDPISVFVGHIETMTDLLERMKTECPLTVNLTTSASFDGGWWQLDGDLCSESVIVNSWDCFKDKLKQLIEDINNQLCEQAAFLRKEQIQWTNFAKLNIVKIERSQQPRKRRRLE
jgi:hypothetical protein